MSEYLPARRPDMSLENLPPKRAANGSQRIREWLSSPVGRAVAEVMPDVIRWAGNRPRSESRSFTPNFLPPSPGANGMTVSEVEVDIDAPFIRRVIIRSASSWSVAPEILKAEQRQRRSRIGVRAATVGLLGIAGILFARRSGISIPGSTALPASIPRMLSTWTAKEDPGEIE